MVASDCPSEKITVSEVVTNMVVSPGVISQVTDTVPPRPADLNNLGGGGGGGEHHSWEVWGWNGICFRIRLSA